MPERGQGPGARVGQTLSHYRITASLGEGGMGEVALKLLPSAFASDPERLARFEREAKVLASLNHSCIAHVYGFERATLEDGSTKCSPASRSSRETP